MAANDLLHVDMVGHVALQLTVTAREQGVPAYVILHDKTLRELAEVRPVSHGLLAGITGMGSAKIQHYGAELLELIRNEG